jgi:hypothetical protein
VDSHTFTATDYFLAANERQQDRQVILNENKRVMFAVYCSGVAIESMLRAYITKISKNFDAKHNLQNLLIASKLTEYFDSDDIKQQIITAIKKASKFWNNNQRYYSEKKLKRQIGHEIARTKYKDVTKYFRNQCKDLFDATDIILEKGRQKWN